MLATTYRSIKSEMGGRKNPKDPTETAPSRGTRFTVNRVAAAQRSGHSDAQGLQVESFGWKSLAELEPQALGLTFWFESSTDGDASPIAIRFAGHRVGVRGKPGTRDHFTVVESLEDVVPGSGPIAVTTRVRDITPGEWRVTATRVDGDSQRSRSASKRRAISASASSSGTTTFARVLQVRAPGAHLGVWPALIGLGVAVGLIVQALLASRLHVPVARVFATSLVACVVGLLGAKLYYLIGRFVKGDRGAFTLLSGACIQGFVLGAAATLVAGARLEPIPVGPLLDATAPALLFGMAIGRYGCFFGGCCVGRATSSRWGLWSSDRHIGMRRVPVQLLESTVALCLGLVAFIVVWTSRLSGGVVFVGAVAAYTFGRQVLFPLRAGPRHTAHGRTLTMALAVLVLAADVTFAIAR